MIASDGRGVSQRAARVPDLPNLPNPKSDF